MPHCRIQNAQYIYMTYLHKSYSAPLLLTPYVIGMPVQKKLGIFSYQANSSAPHNKAHMAAKYQGKREAVQAPLVLRSSGWRLKHI